MEVKHPEVTVQLTGTDANPFMIIGRVKEAMRRAKVPKAEIDKFIEEATSGDYDNVLQTCMKWVDVE